MLNARASGNLLVRTACDADRCSVRVFDSRAVPRVQSPLRGSHNNGSAPTFPPFLNSHPNSVHFRIHTRIRATKLSLPGFALFWWVSTWILPTSWYSPEFGCSRWSYTRISLISWVMTYILIDIDIGIDIIGFIQSLIAYNESGHAWRRQTQARNIVSTPPPS